MEEGIFMALNVGDKLTITKVVTEDMSAFNVGSGSLRVLATPMVIALMENAASKLAQQGLEDIFTTVGTGISIDHTSPTPIGAEVSATATVTKIDGRMLYFDVVAEDKLGVVSKGTHTRVSVKADSFQRKADEKFNG